MNIQLISNADNQTIDSLLLINKDAVATLSLSEAERGWLQKKIDEGASLVSINQYSRTLHVLLVDSKKEQWITLEKIRKSASSALKRTIADKKDSILIVDQQASADYTIAAIEGVYLSSYQFSKYFSKADRKKTALENLLLSSSNISEKQLQELDNYCSSVLMARNWVNEPIMSLPSYEYAAQLKALSEIDGLEVQVFGKQWIEQQGMGGLLAVNRGSIDEPFFVAMEYKPANARNEKPYVLVGKAVVFDTGGLNIKTGGYMEHMKSDMAGSAAVAAVMRSLALSRADVFVKAYIPITDNRPGGNAYAPGDVIKMHNGMFVEVLNTDAEGRMILADALSYAQKDEAALVIDVATLTGSAHATLGDYAAATMGTASEEVFANLLAKAFYTGERLVRFPLWDDYADDIKSTVGDIKNTGGANAGAITAGKFLEYFTNYPWIHIDMSGKSFLKSNDDYRGTGGTGFGVRLLYSLLTKNKIL